MEVTDRVPDRTYTVNYVQIIYVLTFFLTDLVVRHSFLLSQKSLVL